jgi:endonuclease YncB( thermonuclease family)
MRPQRTSLHLHPPVGRAGDREAGECVSEREDAAAADLSVGIGEHRTAPDGGQLPGDRLAARGRELSELDGGGIGDRHGRPGVPQLQRRHSLVTEPDPEPAAVDDLGLVDCDHGRLRAFPRHAVSLALALAAIGAIAPSAPAGAARHAPCLVGQSQPVCWVSHGKVNYVDDGDTIDVDLVGDGTHRGRRVRVTGIQAMEQTVYAANPKKRRGECHAVEAAALVDQLRKLSHGRVRLAAIDPDASSRGRLRRSVAFLVHGQWLDLGRYLISHGAALAFPNLGEYAWNASYNVLQAQTAATGIGLWDTDYCGLGPDDDVPLKLWVNWDADGDDSVNNDGEWIEIQNQSPAKDLSLAGWWVRDSDLRRFRFPSTAHIPPLGSVRVYVGEGPSIEPDFHWGLAFPAFENATYGKRGLGDGAYLFDPQGDMRAWMLYPCRYNCTNPLQGALVIKGQPRGKEYVTVSNVSSFPVDLHGYELTSAPHAYAFGPDSTLQPGETMRIDVQGSTSADTRLEKHMDEPDPILGNNSDSVQIRTFDDIVVTCDSWGGASCEGPRSLR